MRQQTYAFGGLLFCMVAAVCIGLSWASYQSIHRPCTFVLVHGAYGGGWGFRQLDALLTADGNKVFRPTLTGQGDRMHLASPTVDLETHIQDIVNVIVFEDLHDIILVAHSYGGMVITGVADRIPGRIKRVIYLDAILPVDGESVNTAANGCLHHPANVPLDQNGSFAPPGKYDSNSPLPHDEPQPLGTFTQPIRLRNPSGAAEIPANFVLYVPAGTDTRDARFFPFYQRAKSRGWQTETFDSTHNAQWLHPVELAKLLEKISQR